MKQVWLLFTVCGLFLFLGSAGALEMDNISWEQLILQLLAGGGLLYLGQVLRAKAKARARATAKRKAVVAGAAQVQRTTVDSRHHYHPAA